MEWSRRCAPALLATLAALAAACGSAGQDSSTDLVANDTGPGGAGPYMVPPSSTPTDHELAPPPFDPLTRCRSLAASGAAVTYPRPVVTARIHAQTPAAALLTVTGQDGTVFGLREGADGPELVKRNGSSETLLARGTGTASQAGEWMLRLVVEDGALRGKTWPANTHEPSAWQASWSGAMPPIAKVGVAANGDTSTTYLLAGPHSGTSIDDTKLDGYVSCSAALPSLPPPPDGIADRTSDAANQGELRSFMGWALAPSDPRLVVLSSGTSNTIETAGIVTACAAGQCLNHKFEAFELAYAALRAAGYSDADLANPARVRFVMWGFGDTAKGQDLVFHTNGGGADRGFLVRNLGGASAALEGPDGAPPSNGVPYVGTFAYTRQHMNDDATRFRDAVNAYALTAPTFAAHSLVVSHSWGAAYTTAMVLKQDLGFHVDLAMTVALPKIVADLNQLASCASSLFVGGCPDITPELDLPQGFYLGPGGLPLYRVDRPDDPVANAKDITSLVTTLRDVIGDGTFGGHDYVIRSQPAPTLSECTRSYQDCLPGNVLCSAAHAKVSFYSTPNKTSYVGMYGIDSFHLSCSAGGGVLEYRCDDVTKVDTTYCKDPPGNLERLCVAKPSDCP